MMRIHPLHGNVLVVIYDPEGRTKGGIVVPDTAKDRFKIGIVARRADDVIEPDVDDYVLFNPWTGIPVPDDSGRVILRAEDCIAVIADFKAEDWGWGTDEVAR